MTLICVVGGLDLSIGAENSFLCQIASASRTKWCQDGEIRFVSDSAVFSLLLLLFLLILSDCHCHCLYFQRVWDGSFLSLCCCIFFVIDMFETLVASNSLTSASSRSVLLSSSCSFHGLVGVGSFRRDLSGLGNGHERIDDDASTYRLDQGRFGGKLLMYFFNSSEDGIMLANSNPPLVVFNTRQRGKHHSLRRAHEFRSHLRTTVLCILPRV